MSPRLYAVIRALAIVVLRLWFRVRVEGGEHVPGAGPAIIAPHHRNFLDPSFIGIATRRHVRYMAKAELMKGPLGGSCCAWGHLRCTAEPPTPRRCRPRGPS